MRLPSLVTFVLACLLIAAPARADLIVIDPAEYALGTNMSEILFPNGLSLNMLHQSGGNTFQPALEDVFIAPVWPDQTARGLTTTSGMPEFDSCEFSASIGRTSIRPCWYNVLELTFDTPTDFVSITSRYFSDGPMATAYDIAGNRIAGDFVVEGPNITVTQTHTQMPGFTGQTNIAITSDQRNIARIVFGGDSANSPTLVSYNVPEPTPFALVALGLVGLVRLQRRSRLKARHDPSRVEDEADPA